MEGSKIGLWDAVVVGIYFILVFCFGIWSSRLNKKDSVTSYFLASRSMHWVPVGASLFSSCIGAAHFVGLAGSAAGDGIAVAGFELGAIFILMLLGWIFAPVYLSSRVYTMPEYLKKRFGGERIRIYFAFLSLILYIFTKISADLYAGALFIQHALNKPSAEWLYISICILLAFSAVFAITGGLTAVIWTDFIQTILMVFGAFILMGKVFYKISGFDTIMTKYPYAVAQKIPPNDSCVSRPPSDYMHLLRTIEPGQSDFPWTGIVFGLTINAMWYWCTDQVIVQRTLASKSMLHAKAGCIFASYLKILPLFLIIFPGMASRILFADRVGCVDPTECEAICGNPKGCTNIAYIELVVNLMPTGLSGLMLSVMMAAVMTSLTSIFNSSSTIFTIDIWTRLRKNPSNRELIIVGRLAVVAIVIISCVWIPFIRNTGNSRLFDYIQSITAFLAPSICAIFILGILCPRINEPGAFWSLMIGLVIGTIRFVLEFTFPKPVCGSKLEKERPAAIEYIVDRVHYLHFSCLLFVITVIAAIAISLLTEPIPEECLYRLTFWSRHKTKVRESLDTEPPNVEEGSVGAPETAQEAREAAEFLKEDPKWKKVVEFNAILCICVTVFIWGFFA